MTYDAVGAMETPPHGKAIGIEVTEPGDGCCTLRLPYAPHLIGDPDTGVIHGGVITALLDNASGWAVRCHPVWREVTSQATLDLRIDYMRPAVPERTLIAFAECYKVTRNIAFVRAVAHDGDRLDPVATSVAAFMLGTPNAPRP